MNPRAAIRLLIILGAIALLGWVLWRVRMLVFCFIAAAFISILGAPLVELMGRIKVRDHRPPNWLRALVTLLVLVGIFAVLSGIFAPLILEQARIIGELDAAAVAGRLESEMAMAQAWLTERGFLERPVTLEDLVAEVSARFRIGGLADIFGGVIGAVSGALIAISSVLFIAFFFVKDTSMPGRIVRMLAPREHSLKLARIEQNIGRLLTRYVVGEVIRVISVTLLVWIGLTTIGIKSALLIAFVAGILNVIPYVGPLIGAAVGIFVAVTAQLHSGDFMSLGPPVLKVTAVFAAMQLLDNFVLGPVIFSNSVSAHPLEIFAVVFIAGTLAGVTGMLLAIPFYTVLRVVAKEFLSEYRWVDRLTREI